MNPESECPVVILASGQSLRLRKILLYDEDAVTEIVTLRAQAAKGLGSSGLGLGVIGAPSLGFAAEVGAMALLSGMLANAAQKVALEQLKAAQSKYEALHSQSEYFEAIAIKNAHVPNPSTWYAHQGLTQKRFDLGKMSRSQIDIFLKENNRTKRDLEGWTVLVDIPKRYVHNGDEFLNVMTDVGVMSIKWNHVAAYFPAQQGNSPAVN